MVGTHAQRKRSESGGARRVGAKEQGHQRRRWGGWPHGAWRGCALMLGTLACVLLAMSGCGSGTATITPPTATPGPITITTDLSSYSVSQAIGVTVTNTSRTPYYVQNDHSACSIVQLQRYVGGATGWASVDPCNTLQATQVLSITAGLQEPFTLAPTSPGDPNAWDGGIYRVQVGYTTNPDGSTGLQFAYSAGFTIHS